MAERARLLVVDDDRAVVEFLVEALAARYVVVGETSPTAALARVAAERFDVVISDVEMPGMRGPELLAAILEVKPRQAILLITAFGSIQLAVDTIRAGACDFVTKPFKVDLLVLAIERALRERLMRRELVRLRRDLGDDMADELVIHSVAMRHAWDLARRAARSNATVLVTGESGVGKSALAAWIHARSSRRDGPLVHVNCAALPAHQMEAELFGTRDRDGYLVEAARGTLVLDQIGELSLESQAKLLHALESSRIRPVGTTADRETDVRVIATSNYDLEASVQHERFRRDLFLRIDVVRIAIPPLRERREDIPDLVHGVLARASRNARSILGISDEAIRQLSQADWPGNVRELQNVIERAVALSDHDTITIEDIHERATAGDTAPALEEMAAQLLPLAEIELAYIKQVVARVGGNMAHAARVLGIDRRTLYRKLAR